MSATDAGAALPRPRMDLTPALTPNSTVSTNPGYAALSGVRQLMPHCGVAALAATVPTVLSPPTRVSTAAAASALLLIDMTVPFVNHGRALCTARLCCSVG